MLHQYIIYLNYLFLDTSLINQAQYGSEAGSGRDIWKWAIAKPASAERNLKNTGGAFSAKQGLSKQVAMELKVRSWTVFLIKDILNYFTFKAQYDNAEKG